MCYLVGMHTADFVVSILFRIDKAKFYRASIPKVYSKWEWGQGRTGEITRLLKMIAKLKDTNKNEKKQREGREHRFE